MGWHEICQSPSLYKICGVSPAIVDQFRFHMECRTLASNKTFSKDQHHLFKPSDDPEASWCPIDKVTYDEFQNDLIAIGLYSENRIENGMVVFQKPNRDPSIRLADAKHACLLTGLAMNYQGIHESRHSVHRKLEEQGVMLIPGDALQTKDLDEATRRLGQKTGVEEVCVISTSGGYLVHARCWELLQGYAIARRRRASFHSRAVLAPGAFWATGIAAFEILSEEERRPPDFSFDWIDRQEAKALHYQWAMPFGTASIEPDYDFNNDMACAVRRSLAGEGIDFTIREQVWKDVVAWAWQSPHRVEPLGQMSSEIFPPASSKSGSETLFELVPAEIIEAILYHLNLYEALRLAATCKSVRQRVRHEVDQVAYRHIEEHHGWMLPHTPREQRHWDSRLQILFQQQVDAKSKSASESVIVPTKRSKVRIRWLAHMRACLTSPTGSLKNRKRIWKAAEVIYEQAEKQGFLE